MLQTCAANWIDGYRYVTALPVALRRASIEWPCAPGPIIAAEAARPTRTAPLLEELEAFAPQLSICRRRCFELMFCVRHVPPLLMRSVERAHRCCVEFGKVEAQLLDHH